MITEWVNNCLVSEMNVVGGVDGLKKLRRFQNDCGKVKRVLANNDKKHI